MWLFGFGLVELSLTDLIQKGIRIEKLGGLPVPNPSSLKDLSLCFLLSCGAFTGLSLGYLLGLSISIMILLIDEFSIFSRFLIWPLLIIGISLFVYIYPGYRLWLYLVSFMILPFGVYFGYSIPRLIRNPHANFISTKRDENLITPPPPPPPSLPPQGGGGVLRGILILSLIILYLFNYGRKREPMDYLAIRDRVLLSNKVGRFINDFYYIHTPYAAKTIESPHDDIQMTILYIGNDLSAQNDIRRLLSGEDFYIDSVKEKDEILQRVKEGGYDIILLDSINGEILAEAVYTYKDISKIDNNLKNSVVFLLNQEADSSDLKNYPNPVIKKPLEYQELIDSIDVIYRLSDLNSRLRGLVGFSLFRFVVWSVPFLLFLSLLFIISFSAYISNIIIERFSLWGFIIMTITIIVIIGVAIGSISFVNYEGRIKKREIINKIRHGEEGVSGSQRFEYLSRLLRDNDPDIRYEAGYRLSIELRDTRNKDVRDVYDALIEGLKDEDPRVRMWSATGLGYIGNKRAVPYMIEGLNDNHINVRCKIAWALGRLRDKRAIR
ncbi:MAG: HEAT repeat domain-containing protein, partial [Nitrospinae bacterium]|nr:HEAT repeat domain-containing protein [Nitrospinota bacterium]